jgi:hypothetical protein
VITGPATNPCGSCPYRQDVPSGVWAEEEYKKLPPFDGPTADQPMGVFMCHQQDGRICAGWAGCHDMDESLGLRIAVATGSVTREVAEEIRSYVSPVPLWSSGTEAAERGLADLETPGPQAVKKISGLRARLGDKLVTD